MKNQINDKEKFHRNKFLPKKIFSKEKFCAEIKNLPEKNFTKKLPKNNLFLTQNSLYQKLFWTQKVWDQILFWTNDYFGPK